MGGIDVLLVHGPPVGRGDLCMPHGNRAGCVDLLHEIQQRVRPKLCVSGHIHEGYGVSNDGTTTYVNASSCTHGYKASQAPLIFDLVPGVANYPCFVCIYNEATALTPDELHGI